MGNTIIVLFVLCGLLNRIYVQGQNYCAFIPCYNGGTCVYENNINACICVAGFTGINCETNIDDCTSNSCENGGICEDGVNTHTCTCETGYTGEKCEINIDECTSNHCENGGTCEDGVNTYTCTCEAGYTGDNCQTNIDDCNSNACENGGTCEDSVNAHTCTCVAGYTGDNCETDIDECTSNACENGGTCDDSFNTYTCTCVPGYTGDNCETNIDDCTSNSCESGSTCEDGVNTYTCTCVPGYTGENCKINIDECTSNPCENGGTCVDSVNTFTCTCVAGFTGDYCETNIDDCTSNLCENGGTCQDGVNTYTCTCVAGYTGDNCETNIDECTSNPCENGGTCEDSVNTYSCTCVAGYTGDNCLTNIDECTSNACENGGTCEDSVNTYTCTCVAGYTGYNCQTNIDECTSNPCENGGTCEDSVNTYTCTCVAGYTGDNCKTNIDDCTVNACENGGTCEDGVNTHNCTCVAGYTGDNCETNIDECISNHCENGGTCEDGVDTYTCTCVAGYTGDNCQTDIDDCTSNSCENGGTCEDSVNTYTCTCVAGYTGDNCQTNIDECTSNPCENGGTCDDGINTYTCTCVPGYTGHNCLTNINDCTSNSCENGGTCEDGVNTHTCTCVAGYTGDNCQTNKDDCTSNSCENGGTCEDGVNTYTCTCVAGYTGDNCQTNINECTSNPCKNGGTCEDGVNTYTCTCVAGYTGDNCQITTCSGYDCKNGAVCYVKYNRHVCSCQAGFQGTYCRTGLHLGYGRTEGDSIMYQMDDSCSPVLRVSYDLPFMQRRFTNIYVCANGLICFNRPFNGYSIPRNRGFNSNFYNIYCLAPYFADLYLTNAARVWYQAYNTLTDDGSEPTDVFMKVQNLVKEIYVEEFYPVYVLKATWYLAQYYGRWAAETVTFQVIYATDGQRAYAFYNYAEMTSQSGYQFIGILNNGYLEGIDDSWDGSYLRHANKNLILGAYKGAASYQVATYGAALYPNYGVQCLAWRKSEKKNVGRYTRAMNRMPLCPCVSSFLSFDRQFGSWSFSYYYSTFTVPLLPGRAYAPYGKTCAYSRWTGSFIRSGRRAGSFQAYNQYYYRYTHALTDKKYKRICCDLSYNCNFYYEVRPRTQRCYFRSPFRFGGGFGDPHISTLDGVTYTFNGYGEYILLRITSVDFEIQSRTERARKSDGTESEASIFTAFVIQSSDVWLQVELNSDTTGINLFVGLNKTDWVDYTREFQNNGDNFTYVTDELSISRSNNTLVASFSGTGVAFNVTFNVGLLQMGTGLSTIYNEKTSGLLGNFNGDITDDYLPRSASSALPSNSTERDIFFNFGQTWMTSVSESNFKYDNGKSHADYNFPKFVPRFLDEANQTLVEEAKSLCGVGNNPCIFDYVFTENPDLAQTTTATEAQAAEIAAESANEVPELSVINGTTLNGDENYIYVTVNEPATFAVNGTDDGSFTYEFLNNSADAVFGEPKDDGRVDVRFVVPNTNPVYLSMAVKDDKGLNSPPFDIVIVLCSNCNSHGQCNSSVIRDDVRSTDNFKYATCNCEPFWEGADCELDFDGCDVSPCSDGRNCTDRNADVHKANPSLKPYTCTPCPTGFKDVDDKCEDEDECNLTSVCSHICINTFGSYSCQCKTGYRLTQDGATCKDINECEEATSGCSQVCTNTAGSYNCSCYDGFTYNTTSKACDKDQTEPVGCDVLDCTSAAGCTLNETNLPVCFCASGYQIQNNNTCTDIDECSSAVCSQSCSNTVGSFSCACFTGYSLLNDKVSCEPCPFPKYGENCEQTCQCGRGSLRCDPVRGCVCKAGWNGTHCDNDVDECLVPNTCEDVNKECTNTIGSHTCSCRTGYSLVENSCVDIDECDDPALNTCEQVCTNNVGGFSCSCNPGYNIDTINSTKCADYDECTAEVSGCEHICTNKPGRYNCECYFGFRLNADRKTCTKVSDPCTLFPDVKCSDICLIIDEQPQCSCNTGFILGADQQTCIDVNECDPDSDLNLCSEADTCANEAGGYTCSCSAGYKLENDLRTCKECDSFHYGLNCANECNCGVGATRCDHVTGCLCDIGWTGEKCDTDKNECANFPCTGQQEICRNTPGSYSCTCEAGYTEKDGTCQDVDECSSTSLNDCSQICSNNAGSYQCSCNSGFMQNGTSCADINECEGQNECSQLCNNTEGSYRCSCNQGFKLDTTHRKTCIPVEQCDTNPCLANTQCTVVNGVPTCFCEAGYNFESESNTTCEDIEECSGDPSPCSQECSELLGGYECSCNIPGYRLDTDKSTCVACSEYTYGENCTGNCTCEVSNTLSCDTANGSCTCKAGWKGDKCTDNINECNDGAVHNCPVNSQCIDTQGSFYCKCDSGYLKSGDGSCKVCDKGQFGIDCNNTCICITSNTESCNHVNGSCTCKTGWKENDCSQNENECTLNTFTCPQNSTCEDTQGSYKCNCDTGFSKASDGKCEVCDLKYYGHGCATPCSCYAVNTKVCHHVTGICTCNDGWEGEKCSQDIDECISGSYPCNENLRTVCENNNGSYSCQCVEGFELDNADTCVDINECEKDLDDCVQNCNNTDGSYKCFCGPGYNKTGNDCTDINECEIDLDDCLQNCNNTQGSYKCFCDTGYNQTGNDCTDINECEMDLDDCVQNCNNTEGSYTCICDPGYNKTGNDCTECYGNSYGEDCKNTCNCEQNHTTSTTQQCDNVNGTCLCLSTWTGLRCEIDVDECTLGLDSCNNSNEGCHNKEGGFDCSCFIGFKKDSNGTCVNETSSAPTSTQRPECSGNSYGEDCKNTCNCEQNHTTSTTQQCDNVNGTCLCLSTWTGLRCEIDVDECTLGLDSCNNSNEGCHNKEGGFDCSCFIGFKKDSNGTCVNEISSAPTSTQRPDGIEIVNVVLILDITLSSGVDLTVIDTYNKYKAEVYDDLFNIYKSTLPEATDLSIIIRSIRNGSLIVDYDVKVRATDLSDVALTNAKIASSQETLQIFDENATAIGLSINNVNVTVGVNYTDVLVCQFYEAAAGTCEIKCVVIEDKPACQMKTEEDILPLILGLGIGIPMFFICVALLGLCIVYCNRGMKKDLTQSDSKSYQGRNSILFNSFVPTRMNTRVPFGHPDRMDYSGYMEYSRDSRQHDYDNSRSYDNGAERKNGFSWDYLFRELSPREPYKIERPRVDQGTQRYDGN